MLDAGNVIVAARNKYDSNGNKSAGHAIVIYDYHWSSDHGLFLFDIFDPAPVNVGATYSKSYSSLCNGRNRGYDTENLDEWFWSGVVALTIGDYKQTVSAGTP